MHAQDGVRYYAQASKVWRHAESTDAAGVKKATRTKVEVAGYMACRGRWAAWGPDRALALKALKEMMEPPAEKRRDLSLVERPRRPAGAAKSGRFERPRYAAAPQAPQAPAPSRRPTGKPNRARA